MSVVNSNEKLPRHLTMLSGALLNIGTNIGAGIFIVQGSMIQTLKAPGLVIIMFFLGSIISLFGTWAYVDLGLIRPVSGGAKQYLDLAFPKPKAMLAFVFSLTWILAVMPGQCAAVAIGIGKYLLASAYGSQAEIIKNGPVFVAENYNELVRCIAAVSILLIAFIHSFAPRFGIKMQNSLGILKSSVLILAFILGIVAVAGGIPSAPSSGNFNNLFKDANYEVTAIVNSFFKVLFVFDGWASINYSLDEFIDPIKNLPKASFGAVAACSVMYICCTLAYFAVVPVADLISPESGVIGLQFFTKTLGPVVGGGVIPVLISLAAFSCAMCISFAASRLIFDCARDGYFPTYMARIIGSKSSFDSPLNALVLNCILSLAFVYGPPPGPTYELLIDLSSYPEWIFYGISVFGLMVISATRPDIERKIRAPFIGNLIFVIFCAGIMIIPFIPPKTAISGSLPYWTVPVLGMAIILLCVVWWYIQIVLFKGLENSFNAKYGTNEEDLRDTLKDSEQVTHIKR